MSSFRDWRNIDEAYVILEPFNANVNSFDHEQKVSLKNKSLSGKIKHPGSLFELLIVLESKGDGVGDL